jgi:hypothetical protein
MNNTKSELSHSTTVFRLIYNHIKDNITMDIKDKAWPSVDWNNLA